MPAAHLQQSVCNYPVPIKLTLVLQQPKKLAEPAAARFVVFRPEWSSWSHELSFSGLSWQRFFSKMSIFHQRPHFPFLHYLWVDKRGLIIDYFYISSVR
jgi:hypothetical protein